MKLKKRGERGVKGSYRKVGSWKKKVRLLLRFRVFCVFKKPLLFSIYLWAMG